MDLRYSLMDIMDEDDNYTIYDPTTLDISSFNFSSGYYMHTVTQLDRIKPYLISYTYYKTVAYESLILLLNNVDDIFDLPIGTKLKIPKLDDIKTFIKDNRK